MRSSGFEARERNGGYQLATNILQSGVRPARSQVAVLWLGYDESQDKQEPNVKMLYGGPSFMYVRKQTLLVTAFWLFR